MTDVVAALIWDKNKFMICQRPAHKARGLLWEFVGGKVEPGETKEQALIRECREELAVTIRVGSIFMEVIHEYPDITIKLTLFNATISEGVPQMLEHNDIRWISPEEIPQYDFCPADTEILKMLRLEAFTQEELQVLAEKAVRVIPERVRYYAPIIGVDYGRITIRSQKTRWGSCSSKGNLNFNCLLMLTPLEVIDSVVVHELCHRKYMNHSKDFYAEVERVFPDYQKWNKWLKENGLSLIKRLPRKRIAR